MDAVGQDAGLPGVPILLTRVLKNFQSSALSSLSGPGAPLVGLQPSPQDMEEYRKALLNAKTSHKKDKEFLLVDPFLIPPPFPIQQMPVFTPVDTGRAERSDTYLEGETIACFYVGGELRLCLPQILNTVLRDFTLTQINTICDDLHIFCSRCNPDQLETLKATGVLPYTAASCGLITKTDAERLCNALLHRTPPDRRSHPLSPNSLKVYHECFGKGKGFLDPDLYTEPKANCIQCDDCGGMFSPEKFVGHFHRASENRTCHWGFDSANWRHYLLLAKEQEGRDRAQNVLDRIKARFDSGAKYKRKSSPDREGLDGKRHKMTPSPGVSHWGEERVAGQRVLSAFQPWSPNIIAAIKDPKLIPAPPAIMREGFPGIRPAYLKTGPPVLQHPERVIPYSESERYERHFTPNVALAPVSVQKKDGEQEENREEEDEDCVEIVPMDKHISPLKAEPSSTKSTPPQQYCDPEVHNTDTDDSSYSNPSPGSEHLRPDSTTLGKEMEMVRTLVYGKALTSDEERTHFMHEYTKLRTRQEDMLNAANNARRRHKEELADLKKQNERVQIQSECRTQDLEEQIENLTLALEKEKRNTRRAFEEFQIVHDALQDENQTLRLLLEEKGVKHRDIISDIKFPQNGSRSPTPQKSRSFSPCRSGDVVMAGPSHMVMTLPPKKDREKANKEK